MSKIVVCPQCSHVRPQDATNPEWQCPACGVCYSKVGGNATRFGGTDTSGRAPAAPTPVQYGPGFPWFKFVLFLVFAWGGSRAVPYLRTIVHGEPAIAGEVTASRLKAAMVGVTPADIVMYSTTECGYCVQAKEQLQALEVPYTECNMSVSSQCEREFADFHGTGTPMMVVRGKKVSEGMNYDALIAALER
jgi:glutaredoxin